MGFVSDVASRVREFLRRDKERLAVQMAKGATSAGYPTAGYDLLQAYGYDVLSDYLKMETDLLGRYVDYEEMDDYPEISSAVDIFADDASQPDSMLNRTVWVESPDENIKVILDDLFHKTLRLDEEIWEIARTLVKYGNDFEEILVTGDGVRGLNFLPPPTVRRIEGPRGELFGFIQEFKGKFGYNAQDFQQILATRTASIQGGSDKNMSHDKLNALEDWEVAHFRLRGKHRRSVYGYAILEPARWIWKRLMLLEDAALIYRLQRAPERYAFYVDVGDLPPAEALAYVNRVRQGHKKTKYYNPTTGKLDLKYNPMSQDEDFFIPTRKGQDGARIEVLGAPSWQHMDDIEYFRDKLFAALKVPKAYMGQEEGVARAILSSEDVRFARSVMRVQRELRNGLAKVCRVHLAALGIDPYSVDYDIKMTVPSAIFELAQLEVRNARADLAGRMQGMVSMHWLLSNVFGLSDSDIETIFQQQGEDQERMSLQQSSAQAKGMLLTQQIAPNMGMPGVAADPSQGGVPSSPGTPVPPGAAAGEGPVPSQAAAQAGVGPITPDGAAPMSPDQARASLQKFTQAMGRNNNGSRLIRRGAMTEQELLQHDSPKNNRRNMEMLEQILKTDKQMASRLREVQELLNDVRSIVGKRR